MVNGSVRRSFTVLLVSSASIFVVYTAFVHLGVFSAAGPWRSRYTADKGAPGPRSRRRPNPARSAAAAGEGNSSSRPVFVEELPLDFAANQVESGSALKGANVCKRRFAAQYDRYCRKALRPRPANIPAKFNSSSPDHLAENLCPCIPPYLSMGSLQHDLEKDMYEIENAPIKNAELLPGGRWRPTWCVARHRIAILVPYRNRERNLRALLKVMHQTLRRQLLDYTIFVVEQVQPRLFNRGSLLNIGYKESQSFGPFDCLMLHDVDMLPKNDLNFYTCSWGPRHVGRFRDHRVFDYKEYFGGIVAISPRQFERVNGFSNAFYGWGGEDDDFFQRIKAKNMQISKRFPGCVGQYSTPNHKLDRGNAAADDKWKGREYRPATYKHQGLNHLQYKVLNVTLSKLYTNIAVALPPHKS